MRERLEQRKSPLLGIFGYPTLDAQRQRYLNLGIEYTFVIIIILIIIIIIMPSCSFSLL